MKTLFHSFGSANSSISHSLSSTNHIPSPRVTLHDHTLLAHQGYQPFPIYSPIGAEFRFEAAYPVILTLQSYQNDSSSGGGSLPVRSPQIGCRVPLYIRCITGFAPHHGGQSREITRGHLDFGLWYLTLLTRTLPRPTLGSGVKRVSSVDSWRQTPRGRGVV